MKSSHWVYMDFDSHMRIESAYQRFIALIEEKYPNYEIDDTANLSGTKFRRAFFMRQHTTKGVVNTLQVVVRMKDISASISLDAFMSLLKQAAENDKAKFAKSAHVSLPFLKDVLEGNRLPNDRIAKRLGYSRLVLFTPKRKKIRRTRS